MPFNTKAVSIPVFLVPKGGFIMTVSKSTEEDISHTMSRHGEKILCR